MMLSNEVIVPLFIGSSICIIVSYISFYISNNHSFEGEDEEYMYKPLKINSSPPDGTFQRDVVIIEKDDPTPTSPSYSTKTDEDYLIVSSIV